MNERKIDGNIRFAASVPLQSRDIILREIREEGERERSKVFDYRAEGLPIWCEIMPPSTERDIFITLLLQRAGMKLKEAGIVQAEELLPSPSRIIFRRSYDEFWKGRQAVGGMTSRYGQWINIDLPPSVEFGDLETEYVAYHEVCHFVTGSVVGLSDSGHAKVIAHGFENNGRRLARPGFSEEGCANLFSLWCIDRDVVVPSEDEFLYETYFLTALLRKFARINNIEPIDALKSFLKANITRDFSFQREMVAAFGRETVRLFNGILCDRRAIEAVAVHQLEKVAQAAGFRRQFDSLRHSFVEFPGMKAVFGPLSDIMLEDSQ